MIYSLLYVLRDFFLNAAYKIEQQQKPKAATQKKDCVFLEVAFWFFFSLHQKLNKNTTKVKYQLPTLF